MFIKGVLQYRVTWKPGLFLTGNQILSSAYPRDLLDSALALLCRAVVVFQVCRKDDARLKPLPPKLAGHEDETGPAVFRRGCCALPVSAFHCHRFCFPSADLSWHWPSFQATFSEATIAVGQHNSMVSLLKETTDLLKTPK